MHFNTPTLVTLTAPSCAGKSYLLEAMVDSLGMQRIVSTTDRAPRAGEIEGVHYNFITTNESLQYEAEGKFAELVTFNGTRYGVTHEEMEKKLVPGAPAPIVILEPNGVNIYRQYCGSKNWSIFTVFVSTPEAVRLERLAARTTADLLNIAVNGGDLEKSLLARGNLFDRFEKIVHANNKRLKAIIEQERLWAATNLWDAQITGQDLNVALSHLKQSIASRNARSAIYA
jgi:guanylate kinase